MALPPSSTDDNIPDVVTEGLTRQKHENFTHGLGALYKG